jgi:protein NRD1
MQFVVSGGVIASAAATGMIPGQYQAGMMGMEQGWPQSGVGFGGRHGGGFPNQGGGPGYGHTGAGFEQKSDAIVLGGGESGDKGSNTTTTVQSPLQTTQMSSPPGGGGPGGMQRLGDNWIFVRDEAKV